MTYCLALRLNEGLLFMADTRTNAGVDNVSTFRKLHVLRVAPDRLFVLQSAGNLATTREVLDRINRDLITTGDHESLATVNHLFEAALYIGRLSQEISANHRRAFISGGDATATFILGGQVGDEAADLLLVYPEGNYIRASDERPFLQIGESKYGKSLLDIAVQTHVDIETATKIALGSMLTTAQANLSVGPPYDVAIYHPDTRLLDEVRFEADSPLLGRLVQVWTKHILNAIAELPTISQDDFSVKR